MRDIRDPVLLLARLMLCLIFILYGWGKIFTMAGFAAMAARDGLPLPWLMPAVAIVIELGGGLVLALGIETRVLAVLFALYTLATAVIGHAFWSMDDAARAGAAINFYKNIGMAGGFLLLAVTGGGRFALDAVGLPWRARSM